MTDGDHGRVTRDIAKKILASRWTFETHDSNSGSKYYSIWADTPYHFIFNIHEDDNIFARDLARRICDDHNKAAGHV